MVNSFNPWKSFTICTRKTRLSRGQIEKTFQGRFSSMQLKSNLDFLCFVKNSDFAVTRAWKFFLFFYLKNFFSRIKFFWNFVFFHWNTCSIHKTSELCFKRSFSSALSINCPFARFKRMQWFGKAIWRKVIKYAAPKAWIVTYFWSFKFQVGLSACKRWLHLEILAGVICS